MQHDRVRTRPKRARGAGVIVFATGVATALLAPLRVHSLFGAAAPRKPTCTVNVCQNKDCRKRFSSSVDASLVRTFRDLLDGGGSTDETAVSVESSGCLSQCGRGPNVCISAGKTEKLYFGVDTASTAAAILEVACDYDPPVELIMAVDKIWKAQTATSPTEKESLLTPVIDDLSSNPEFASSSALANALVLRADARLDASPQDIHGALEDIRRSTAMDGTNGRAWRVRSDAEEATGNIREAMEAVSRWAEAEPSFQPKAKKELERLSSKLVPL